MSSVKIKFFAGDWTRGLSPLAAGVDADSPYGHILFMADRAQDEILAQRVGPSSQISVMVPGRCSGEGVGWTVNAGRLLKILGSVPPETECSLTLSGRRVTLGWGRAKYQFDGLAVEDMPILKMSEETVTLGLVDGLPQMLAHCQWTIARQDVRMWMTGASLVTGKGQMTVVATKGSSLARSRIESDAPAASAIIPRDAVNVICKLFGKADDGVMARVDENMLEVRHEGTVFITRLIDARWPDIDNVMNSAVVGAALVKAGDLANVLGRMSYAQNIGVIRSLPRVCLTFRGESLNVHMDQTDNTETISVTEAPGAPMIAEDQVTGYSPGLLSDALSEFDPGSTVRLTLTESGMQVGDPDSLLCIVAPVRE